MKIIFGQLLRYGIVGVITNGSEYLVYLILTKLGLGHKTKITLLYGVSIVLTFILINFGRSVRKVIHILP